MFCSRATPVVRGGETGDVRAHTNITQFAYVFKRGHRVKNTTLSELECRELTQQVCSLCRSLKQLKQADLRTATAPHIAGMAKHTHKLKF